MEATKREVVKELLDILGGKLTKDNFPTALQQGVLIMRKYSELKGAEKKQVLLESLKEIIQVLDGDDTTGWDYLLGTVAVTIIDSFVWFAKSGVNMDLKKFWCCI